MEHSAAVALVAVWPAPTDQNSAGPTVTQPGNPHGTAARALLHAQAAQLILSDVWRWRRRGGGMDDETDRPNYAIALESLQNMEPEQIDRITSSLVGGWTVGSCWVVVRWWLGWLGWTAGSANGRWMGGSVPPPAAAAAVCC